MEKDRDEDGAINSNSRPVCLFLPANLIFIVFDTAQRLKNACGSSTCTTLVHICFAVIPFLLSGLCDCRCWGLNSLSLPGTLFSLSLSHATARFILFYFYFFTPFSFIFSCFPVPSSLALLIHQNPHLPDRRKVVSVPSGRPGSSAAACISFCWSLSSFLLSLFSLYILLFLDFSL